MSYLIAPDQTVRFADHVGDAAVSLATTTTSAAGGVISGVFSSLFKNPAALVVAAAALWYFFFREDDVKTVYVTAPAAPMAAAPTSLYSQHPDRRV
jgi:hypothetical protein